MTCTTCTTVRFQRLIMVKKDKWLTYPDVARTAEKLILNGIPEEKINGSMVWD